MKYISFTRRGGATVLSGNFFGSGGVVTLSSFINGSRSLAADPNNALFQHEYGHYIQSQNFGYLYYGKFGLPSATSKGTHNDHPVEQDANIRSLKYYYENGLYDELWDKRSLTNKINGYNHYIDYYDSSNQEALQKIIKLNWYDFVDLVLISGIVNSIVLNKKY